MAILSLTALFYLAQALGIFELGSKAGSNYNSLPVVFFIGLTAGISTCMAIVGGLILGASARFAEKHPYATSLQKFKPHLFFNLGRIVSYTVLGGVIGYLGSFLSLSTSVLGILTIAVGFVMLLLGVQLTEIIPGLNKFKLTIPARVSRLFGIKEKSTSEYSHTNSFIMGGLTFFLPCGFTQAMQLFAISSGNPVTGALTMGVFAIGTAPGLLGIGGLTAAVKGAFARHFFRFAGIVVTLLALFNISNGWNLASLSINLPSLSNTATAQVNDPNVTVENGVQIVKMTQSGSGYSPDSFTIQKGIPVKWVINSTNAATCASSIIASQIDVRKQLSSGENIIEFTPNELGTINFSCSMGMYTGSFTVVEAKEKSVKPAALKTVPQEQPTPTSVVVEEANAQIVKATYSLDNDIQPRQFEVKADQEARLEIEAQDDGAGCMGSVMIPGLTEPQGFSKGQTTVLSFKPKKGAYQLTCAMGIPRGEIIVE
jgi:sulfite exporter TauE/SafE/plastocyanin domain-containing protein